jgi:hypothetical protein
VSDFPEDCKILVLMRELPDPFEHWPWISGGEPLTREEVHTAIMEGRFEAAQYPGPTYGLCGTDWTREQHIQRVAHFVVHGWPDTILVEADAGGGLSFDGHHRIAAARYLGHTVMPATGCGFTEPLERLHREAKEETP